MEIARKAGDALAAAVGAGAKLPPPIEEAGVPPYNLESRLSCWFPRSRPASSKREGSRVLLVCLAVVLLLLLELLAPDRPARLRTIGLTVLAGMIVFTVQFAIDNHHPDVSCNDLLVDRTGGNQPVATRRVVRATRHGFAPGVHQGWPELTERPSWYA
jgi:hypothetical protein